MKRLFAMLLVLAMVLAMTGCSTNTNSGTNTTAPAQEGTSSGTGENNAPSVDFPTRPVTFIVPFAAGGSSDMMSRAFCNVLQDYLGVPVNVENKPGGSGAVGATYLLSQPADGYTLVYGTTGMMTTLPYTQDVEYDPVEDFTYLGCFAMHDILLVVPANSPYETLEDYIAAAKEAPGRVSYGQSSPGGANRIAMEEFEEAAGIELNMIAYENGTAEITAALLGNHLESGQVHPSDVMEHLKAGTLRALAVFSDERKDYIPDVPTLKECGIDVSAALPRGIACHGDTPDEIVAILEQAIADTMNDPKLQEGFDAINEGNSLHYLTGAEMRQTLIDMTQTALPIMDRLGMLPN